MIIYNMEKSNIKLGPTKVQQQERIVREMNQLFSYPQMDKHIRVKVHIDNDLDKRPSCYVVFQHKELQTAEKKFKATILYAGNLHDAIDYMNDESYDFQHITVTNQPGTINGKEYRSNVITTILFTEYEKPNGSKGIKGK